MARFLCDGLFHRLVQNVRAIKNSITKVTFLLFVRTLPLSSSRARAVLGVFSGWSLGALVPCAPVDALLPLGSGGSLWPGTPVVPAVSVVSWPTIGSFLSPWSGGSLRTGVSLLSPGSRVSGGSWRSWVSVLAAVSSAPRWSLGSVAPGVSVASTLPCGSLLSLFAAGTGGARRSLRSWGAGPALPGVEAGFDRWGDARLTLLPRLSLVSWLPVGARHSGGSDWSGSTVIKSIALADCLSGDSLSGRGCSLRLLDVVPDFVRENFELVRACLDEGLDVGDFSEENRNVEEAGEKGEDA